MGAITSPLTINVAISTPTRIPLTAIIAYQGTVYIFSEATGTDLGDYVDQHFTQRCIRATSALPRFAVFFRPDADGSREEVVFELGQCFDGGAPALMGGYTAEIRQGSVLLASITVPTHYYRSRWRWQSAPRPVRANISDLITAGLLPHYDESLTGGFTPATPAQTYSPMGLAGVNGNMAQTGERPDIGPVTEYQADFICTGRNLSSVLAQAEASGTIPWHHRDENTGAPIDTAAYPKASMYNSSSPSPFLPRDWALDQNNPAHTIVLNPDPAHEPALAYLPFLLTGDPYYLEELQFAVNFNILAQPWNGRAFNIYGAIRAHAWSLRSAAQAAKLTPDVVPSWLLPRAYFVRHLNANRDWMLVAYVNNPAAPWTTFRTVEQTFGDNNEAPAAPSGTYCQDYMEEFEAFVLGWVVQMGFEDWRPIFEWKILNTIARTNGTSGWIRAWCTPYRQIMRASRTDPWLPDWAASWALTQQRYPTMTYTDPNALPDAGNDISYPGYTLGVLAMADRLGVAAAAAPHAWMAGQIRGLLTTQRRMARKWCVS